MAPDPKILKRQRSRPSEWWAASPSTTIQSTPAVPPSKGAIPTSNLSATERSSESVQTNMMAEKQVLEKVRSEPKSAPDTPQDTDRLSLKRKRARPSDWWAASPAVQSTEQPILQEDSREASQILGDGVGKSPAVISEATPSKRGSQKPGEELIGATDALHESQSLHAEHRQTKSSQKIGTPARSSMVAPVHTESRVSKRKRARPSDWWAAKPSTSSQEDKTTGRTSGEAANVKHLNQVPKDVSPRGNQGKTLASVENGKETPKLKAAGKILTPIAALEPEHEKSGVESNKQKANKSSSHSQLVRNKKGKSKVNERDRVTPPRVLNQRIKDQELPGDELAEPSVTDTPQLRASRSSNTTKEAQAVIEAASVVPKPKGKRTQTSKQNPGVSVEELASVDGVPRHRSQKRRSGVQTQDSAVSINSTKGKPRGKCQYGSVEVLEVQTASSNFGRGRPKKENRVELVVESSRNANKSVVSRKGGKTAESQTSQAPSNSVTGSQSKNGARVSETNVPRKKRTAEDKIVKPARGVKRLRVSEATQEEEDDDENELPQYQHLAEVTRKVNRSTIEKSWEGLPPSAIELISQLLHDTQRPVVVRISDQNKRAQANTALQMISRRLMSKVSRGLPFPKSIGSQREDDFNFEKIIDRNRMLEGQLTAEVDASKLLEENLNKELSRLEAEKAILAELEANAKTESAMRKEAARKIHPLLQSASSAEVGHLEDSSNLGVSRVPPTLGVSTDEGLQAVVRDLEGHVESLQSNFKALSGLPEAMIMTRAAVQITLFDHLDGDRYEEVVLGPEASTSN